MAFISTLRKRDLSGTLELLKELVRYWQAYKVNINYLSRPVLLFLGTLVSTAGLGILLTLRNIIQLISESRNEKRRLRPLLIRQSSTILKNGAREIHIPIGRKASRRIIIPKPNLDRYAADKYLYKNFQTDPKLKVQNSIFDSKFLSQLAIIWRILVPKFYSKNSALILAQCFFLILRTWLSLLVAKLDGQIVKNLIAGNGRKFTRDIIYWLLIAFPASYTNAAIKFLTDRLSLSFRTNLMRYVHDIYLDKVMAYYKISFNKESLQNIDQYITNDIAKFCDSICGLFSSMGKPFIDLIFFAVYLRDTLGTGAIIGIFANYFVTAYFLKKCTPKFGKLTSVRTHLEGEYYNQHLSLSTNCEEIGFYKGSIIEKSKLNETYRKLMKHIKKEININFSYAFLEDYVLKYTWSAWGYIFAGLPVFLEDVWNMGKTLHNQKVDERRNMRQFVINKRLLLSLADAGSRLMYSIKDISALTGYTDRVFNLLSNLHEAHSPKFGYGTVGSDIKGTIHVSIHEGLRFEETPVIIPGPKGLEGDLLIKDLNFKLSERKNLLILGPNGCGKTSVARILAGLWPLYRGLLSKPDDDEIFYLPQKTYFPNGNLRDQIIYPNSYEEMIEMGYNDDHLFHILRLVKLDYLLKREGNFNVKKDWRDVLSGGEKQRMSFARVLFKRPSLVVLDESTNAVSTDVEDYLFELLQKEHITFVTLSHRPLLMKYHDFILEIKSTPRSADNLLAGNEANWEYHDLTSEENLKSIDKEIKEIRDKLALVEEWEKRKEEVELYLDGKYDDINDI